MGKTIAGVCMIRNNNLLGYCVDASVKSLQAFCDHVFVVYVEGDDDTLDTLKSLLDDKTTILTCTNEQWQAHRGQTKLSAFQNTGIDYAHKEGYDYTFLCQGDESVHQDSIPFIRQAVELDEEAFYVTRVNLWKDVNHMLNVPQNRKPVSSVVNRLAKSIWVSVGDGESIASSTASLDFINKIEIFHVGFVRNPKKHIAKIKEIQGNIFAMDVDQRAFIRDEFNWKDWGFTEEDLLPIHKPLPSYLNNWLENLNK